MKIFIGALFSIIAIFLFDCVGIISSESRTLEDLFPGFNGILPPVEKLWFDGQLEKFKKFGDKRLTYIATGLAKRRHIIFGGLWPNFIHDLYELFDSLEPTYFVFDMNENEWVTVSRDLSRKLGAGRHFNIAVARDEVAARHVTTSNNPRYKEAHRKACRQANDEVDKLEQEQLELRKVGQTTMESILLKIEEEYSQSYNLAFTRYLHLRGEYDINGRRGMHP